VSYAQCRFFFTTWPLGRHVIADWENFFASFYYTVSPLQNYKYNLRSRKWNLKSYTCMNLKIATSVSRQKERISSVMKIWPIQILKRRTQGKRDNKLARVRIAWWFYMNYSHSLRRKVVRKASVH
jgi:hypothetical protein